MRPDNKKDGVDRRKFLVGGAAATAAAMAGCPGDGGDGEDGGDGADGGDGDDGPTPTPTEPPEQIPTGGTFSIALPEPPTGLNILTTSSSYSVALYEGLVHEYGTYLDPFNYEVHPWVFTDWTAENVDSGEPDVYFNVREGLTFNDGEDLTIDDVLFTYDYLLEQQPGKYAAALSPINSVEEADNDWDLHMSLDRPYGTYASTQLAMPILPQHIWQEVDNIQEYTPGQRVDEGRPVGAGMGNITTYRPDTAIEVEMRDPEEYQLSSLDWVEEHPRMKSGGPFLDSIQFNVFTNQSTRVQNFLNGNVDSIYSSVPADTVSEVENADGKSIVPGTDTGYGFVAFNLRRQPLDDLPFRQMMGFLWDDVYYTRRLNLNQAIEGDFVAPPGYSAIRPESADDDVEMLTDPATQAFSFRQSGPGVPDYEAIRQFLTEGQMITGESGTYAGQEYPGSITGVSASQTEPKYDYSFGEVQDPLLQDAGATAEIRVNGQRIRELTGSPIEYFSYPPGALPELNEMDKDYVSKLQKLGIPVKRTTLTFNTLLTDTFVNEDFDITHLGWGSTSPFGVSTLNNLFHSSQADDRSEGNDERQLNNMTGYGLFEDAGADDLIDQATRAFERQERLDVVRQAIEKIYLDMPYMVFQYDKLSWPINSDKMAGWEGDIAGPGSANIATQWLNLYRKE